MKYKSLCKIYIRNSVAALLAIVSIWMFGMIGVAEAIPTPDPSTYNLDGFLLTNDGSNYYTIIGYEGNENALIIPSHFEGNPIAAIGNSAFAHCDNLVEVTMPEGIKSIGDQAFIWCKNLETITIPDGVEYIGSGAFRYCYELEHVSLPSGVVSAEPAFNDCVKMIKRLPNYEIIVFENDACIIKSYHGVDEIVTIPDSLEGKTVVGIGQYAFMGNKKIKEIHMPDSIRAIGDSAFYQCMNLECITFSKNLITLGRNAFNYCWKVEELNLPDGLTTIGASAFSGMEALKEVTIPDSVMEIGANAFRFCKSLTIIEIPESVTRLEAGTFGDCSSLHKVTLPPTVTYFGTDLFFWCNNLYEIWGEPGSAAETYAKENNLIFISVLKDNEDSAQDTSKKVHPAGTRIIGDFKIEAYADGTCGIMDYYGSDKQLVIPKYVGEYKVIEICGTNPYWAPNFEHYNGVTSVFIPEGIERIGAWAFGAGNFTEIWIPDSALMIEPDFLDLCDQIESIHISVEHPILKFENNSLIDKRDNTLLLFCGKQATFDVPTGIVTIGEDAFYNKENLLRVTIPSSVRTLRNGAFAYCTNLESVRISEGVQRIDTHAFLACYRLSNINLPKSLVELKNEAFYLCDDLERIVMPDRVIKGDDLEELVESPIYYGFNRVFLNSPPTLDVYSGPGEDYYRNAEGRAVLATSDKVYCAGSEDNWLMVAYESNEGIPKIGYVQNPISAANFEFSKLTFDFLNSLIIQDCELKDTPYSTGNSIKALNSNQMVTYLESYIEDDRGTVKWVYIETSIDGKKIRGYIPHAAIQITETEE